MRVSGDRVSSMGVGKVELREGWWWLCRSVGRVSGDGVASMRPRVGGVRRNWYM